MKKSILSYLKRISLLIIASLFSINAGTTPLPPLNSMLHISLKEGNLSLFGIKWNDLSDQSKYPAKVLANPLENLKVNESATPEQLESNYEDLIKLVERNLTFRAKAALLLSDVKKLRKQQNTGDTTTTLSPKLTSILTNGAKEFLILRYLNTYIFKKYEKKAEIIFSNRSKKLKDLNMSQQELVEFFMGLSAALTLYDNYVLMISEFEKDFEINRIFKSGIDTLGIPGNAIETISENSRKLKYRVKLGQIVKWMNDNKLQIKAHEYTELDQAYNYLLTYINSTATYKIFSQPILIRHIQNFYKRFSRGFIINFLQDLIGVEREIANGTSKGISNTIGLFEARKGYMYVGKGGKFSSRISHNDFDKVSKKQRIAYHLKMRESLEPGDVLIEKTPFRLTDKFIPGYWGHVAIWTGTITDLKERGLWKHIINSEDWLILRADQREYIINSLKDNYEDPIKDRAILEALRPGVQLNNLYHFLNVDDVAILKPKLVTQNPISRNAELAKIIAKSFTHALKDYDFNFDVRDTNKIVCSELAWHTYTDCHFKTQTILSRASINPDDIADAVFGDKNGKECFSVNYIVHDGQEVDPKKHDLREALKSLNESSSL